MCHKIGDQLQLTQSTLTKCETAICKIYGHTSNYVNLVRYNMLNQGAESQDNHPTKDALLLHIQRANCQALVMSITRYPVLMEMDGQLLITS